MLTHETIKPLDGQIPEFEVDGSPCYGEEFYLRCETAMNVENKIAQYITEARKVKGDIERIVLSSRGVAAQRDKSYLGIYSLTVITTNQIFHLRPSIHSLEWLEIVFIERRMQPNAK